MNLPHLLVSLGVEVPQLLAGRGTKSLLEVRAKSPPPAGGLVAQFVVLVEATGTVTGLVLLVEVAEDRSET